jgi:membrane protease YdiL (CAAX protease family)
MESQPSLLSIVHALDAGRRIDPRARAAQLTSKRVGLPSLLLPFGYDGHPVNPIRQRSVHVTENCCRQAVRWRRVVAWCAVLFTVSYGSVGAFLLAGGSMDDPSLLLFFQASALVPALAAVVMTRWLWREPVADALALRPGRKRWLAVAWLAAWCVALLALGFGALMPGVAWDPGLGPAVDRNLLSPEQLELLRGLARHTALPPVLLLVPFGVIASLTISLVAGCGEEIGWRGFVYGELRPLGFWRAAVATGLLWLAWHLPLLALGWGTPRHPWLGALAMSIHIMISAVGLAWLRERAASSLAAGLFHGTTEATLLLAVAPLAGGSDLAVGGAGTFSFILAEAAVVLGLLAWDRFLAAEPVAFRRR